MEAERKTRDAREITKYFRLADLFDSDVSRRDESYY